MANIYSHSILTTAKNTDGVFGTSTVTFAGDAEDNFNFTTPLATTNEPHVFVVAKAALVDVIINVSGACVITTNSTTTPANTFTFTGSGVMTGPLFTVDVTQIFITNASASSAVNVSVSILRTL